MLFLRKDSPNSSVANFRRFKKRWLKGAPRPVYGSLLAVWTLLGTSPPEGAASQKLPYDDEGAMLVEQESVTSEHASFSKGTWNFQAYGSASFGDNAGELYDGHVGVGYFFRESWSLNLTALGGYGRVEEEGSTSQDTALYGMDLLVRWHFRKEFFGLQRASLYGEGGAGIMQSSVSVPDDGSNFNFRPQAGLGMTYQVHPQMRLMTGARWLHISNAGIDEDNPGVNQAFVYFGVSVPF